MRRTSRQFMLALIAGALVLSNEVPVRAQALSADSSGPSFEVASVKSNRTGGPRMLSLGLQPGGRFVATNASLRELIAAAYGSDGRALQAFRIVGGPGWIDTDRFDIEARAEGEARRRMFMTLRTLLRERFALAVHTDTRQLPTYALRMAADDGRLGPQLRRAVLDCGALRASGQPLPAPEPGQPPPCALSLGPGLLRGRGMSSREIVLALSPLLDRVVTDRTGLDGVRRWLLRSESSSGSGWSHSAARWTC